MTDHILFTKPINGLILETAHLSMYSGLLKHLQREAAILVVDREYLPYETRPLCYIIRRLSAGLLFVHDVLSSELDLCLFTPNNSLALVVRMLSY